MRRGCIGFAVLALLVACQPSSVGLSRPVTSGGSNVAATGEHPSANSLKQLLCRSRPSSYSEVGDAFLYAPPDPSAVLVCRHVAEAIVRRVYGATDTAPTYSALMTRAAAENFLGRTNRRQDRLLWVVTVVWPVMTDGSPWVPPRTVRAYTMDIDAETGLPAGDICIGCATLSANR